MFYFARAVCSGCLLFGPGIAASLFVNMPTVCHGGTNSLLLQSTLVSYPKEKRFTTRIVTTVRRLPQSVMRMLRRKVGLTQRELAFVLGYRRHSKVARYESGERFPQASDMIAIEYIFSVTGRVVFPDLHADIARRIAMRIRELQRRNRQNYCRMSEARASYKAEQLESILASLRRQGVIPLNDETSVWRKEK